MTIESSLPLFQLVENWALAIVKDVAANNTTGIESFSAYLKNKGLSSLVPKDIVSFIDVSTLAATIKEEAEKPLLEQRVIVGQKAIVNTAYAFLKCLLQRYKTGVQFRRDDYVYKKLLLPPSAARQVAWESDSLEQGA